MFLTILSITKFRCGKILALLNESLLHWCTVKVTLMRHL